jgi:hypothetical protein
MQPLVKIVKIVATSYGSLDLEFADGSLRRFEPKRLVEHGPLFAEFNDPLMSGKSKVIDQGLAMSWGSGIEVSAETIYRLSEALSPAPEPSVRRK